MRAFRGCEGVLIPPLGIVSTRANFALALFLTPAAPRAVSDTSVNIAAATREHTRQAHVHTRAQSIGSSSSSSSCCAPGGSYRNTIGDNARGSVLGVFGNRSSCGGGGGDRCGSTRHRSFARVLHSYARVAWATVRSIVSPHTRDDNARGSVLDVFGSRSSCDGGGGDRCGSTRHRSFARVLHSYARVAWATVRSIVDPHGLCDMPECMRTPEFEPRPQAWES